MKQAFTLLEMLLVLAIISLLVYVGTAGMIRFRENAEAEQSTQEILAFLSETQTKAKNNTIPYAHRFIKDVKNRSYAFLITRTSVVAVAENNQYLAAEAAKAKVMGEDTMAMQYYITDPIYVNPPIDDNPYVTGPAYITVPAYQEDILAPTYLGPAVTVVPYVTAPPATPIRYILQRRICWKDLTNPTWATLNPVTNCTTPEDITSRYSNISVELGMSQFHGRPNCNVYFISANEGILFENLTGKVISSVDESVVNCQLALKMLSQDINYSYIDFATGNFKRAY